MRLSLAKLSTKLFALTTVFVVALIAAVWVARATTVPVNGPEYARIVASKDLIADVLPPPAYLLEAHLVVHQLARATAAPEVATLAARLDEVRAEFDARQQHWATALAAGPTRTAMADARGAAERYFGAVDAQLLPALRAGDAARAQAALDQVLVPAYQEHLGHVHRVVAQAKLAITASERAAADEAAHGTTSLLLGVGLLLALVLVVATLIIRQVRTSVDSVDGAVRAMAARNLTPRTANTSQDEFGQLSRLAQDGLASIRGAMMTIDEQAHGLAAAAEELRAVSDTMSTTAEQTSSQASEASDTSEQVKRNVQMVAGATEQMNASIRDISQSTSRAAGVASEAVRATQGASDAIRRLGDSSGDIGKVVQVISSIAEQTNLLALNATIEAARAGEAGKGFAVVANEVKELAGETARATDDITRKIDAIRADTANAVAAIEQIHAVIAQVNELQSTIAAAVEEQSATTLEISRSVGEGAQGTTAITRTVGEVAQAARHTSTAAGDTRKAATELSRMTSELRTVLAAFTY